MHLLETIRLFRTDIFIVSFNKTHEGGNVADVAGIARFLQQGPALSLQFGQTKLGTGEAFSIKGETNVLFGLTSALQKDIY